MASPPALLSPPLSVTTSSYDGLSTSVSSEMSPLTDTSDDRIIWSPSEASSDDESDVSTESSLIPASDDDFVVLSRQRTPTSSESGDDSSDLASEFAVLSVCSPTPSLPGKGKESASDTILQPATAASKRSKARARARPSPSATPKPPSAPTAKPKPKSKSKAKKAKKAVPPPPPPPAAVAVSTAVLETGDSTAYDEAVNIISAFLADPPAKEDQICRLVLLQSLIVELGLASSSLPGTLSSAKAFLKSRAFLNIREYLAVREQGQAAVQSIMHPSRTALIKDIRKKRNPASLRWVKQSGLNVLLVSCYH